MTDTPATLQGPVLVSRLAESNAVARVTINRPDKLNALNREVLELLIDTVCELRRDASVRAVVITGSGDKAFVAGADISAMRTMGVVAATALSDLGHRLGDTLESSPFAILAAVNGFALGGGCELAMACDLIYASDKARFGQPEVNLGVIPGFGGTQRLSRRVGVGKARELVYTADIIDATEAHRIGLCEAVFPHQELLGRVESIAQKIASKGPLAIAQAKRAMRRGDALLSTANELETQAFAALFGSSDQKEAMAAFVEKRTPEFRGA